MSNINDFRIENGVLYGYSGSGGAITLPDSVTEIADSAFSYNKRITSVTIPDTVTSIGDFAFSDCADLTSINVPDSVTSIGIAAFCRCKKLKSIDIPRSVTTLNGMLFYLCEGLEKVTLPDTLECIGNFTFDSCKNLTDIDIPLSVTSIGDMAFNGCAGLADSEGFVVIRGVLYSYHGSDTGVVIPNSVARIGAGAFSECDGIVGISIPDSVTRIDFSAFRDCNSLKSIYIPDTVTYIGSSAFYGCSNLESICIPDSVKDTGDFLFTSCKSLREVVLPKNAEKLDGVTKQIWDHISDSKLKPVIMSSFLKYASDSIVNDPDVYKKLRSNKTVIVQFALSCDDYETLDKLFAMFKKISLEELDRFIDSAENAPLCRSYLLNYKSKRYSPERINRAEEIKNNKELGLLPLSVAEYKKIYRYTVIEEGIVITGYKGDEINVVVPSVIGKHSVIAIGVYAFSPLQKRLRVSQRIDRFAIDSVTVPDTVTHISGSAFLDCTDLALRGSKGSFVEKYAEQYGMAFKGL